MAFLNIKEGLKVIIKYIIIFIGENMDTYELKEKLDKLLASLVSLGRSL